MKRIFTRLMLTVAMLLMCGAAMAQTGFAVYLRSGEVDSLMTEEINPGMNFLTYNEEKGKNVGSIELWLKSGEKITAEIFCSVFIYQDYLNLDADYTNYTFPISDVRKIIFVEPKEDGIEAVNQDKEMLARRGDGFTLSNLTPLTLVEVYSTDGKVVFKKNSGYRGEVEISLAGKPAGIYTIRTARSSYKIIKK